MHQRFSLLAFGLLAFTLTSVSANAQEWTRFRGPNGNGQSDSIFPAKWSVDDYKWVVDLPGIGHSSPVIWGKRLFVQSAAKDGTQYVLCLDASSGKTIWRKDFSSAEYHIHARNSFASSSPAVDKDTVYVTWATPDQITLTAFSHDGKVKWARDDLGSYASQHGFGSSPVLIDDMVILPNLQMPSKGDDSLSSVMAFDPRTGKTRWSTPRVSGKASYSLPCLRESPDGRELVLCSTTHGMFGLDLKSGAENWSVKDAFKMRTVSSPILVGEMVFGSTGSGGGGNYVVAIDGRTKSIKYKVDKQAPYVPTPVAFDELVFLWSDKGIVRCIDATTGDTHWMERVGGNYSGSPVRAADKVYCISESGLVVVLAADTHYAKLGETALGEDSRSTPAISGDQMYLRTYSKLFCLGN